LSEAGRWGPDPERARRLASDLAEHLGTGFDADALVESLCAHAPFLVPMLRRHPEWLSAAARSDLARPFEPRDLDERLASARTSGDPAAALRRCKYEALLRITLRDLSCVPLDRSAVVLRELSELAARLLDASLAIAEARVAERRGAAVFGETPAHFCVLGLGKLGAGELNYSSDVDLIYLMSDVAPAAVTARGATPIEYFAALAQEFGALVSTVEEDGFLYRVDLDLRPEGGRGPLVISEGALQAYYEVRADTWERAAFAKARPIAGDLELGWHAIGAVDPTIFRSSMDLATIRGIRHLKHSVVEEHGARGGFFDVKRDPGGIRDVEFVAQALQLLHGGRIPQLRDRSTLGALARLAEVNLLPAADAEALAAAYRFLRRLENRMQMRDERQVHAVPTDAEGAAFWAAAMQLSERDFSDTLEAHRQTVRTAAEVVFPEDRAEAVLELFSRHQPALIALPESRRMMEQLADDLSREIAASSDPELAFNNLDRFVEGVGGRRFYYELLLDRPELVPRLCALFASSRFLSNLLAQYPRLIEPVFDDPSRLLLSPAQLREDLASLRARVDPGADGFEDALKTLRLFSNRQTLNIGLLDLGGEVPRAAVETALSDLAQIALEYALAIAEAQLSSRRPDSLVAASFLVVGMGKLASRELGYGSDLDLIFLYDLATTQSAVVAEAQEFFVRLIQRLISALQTQTAEGRCYEIDARLRPSGSQGSLVCSLEAFERYHAGGSQAWERQALLRSRAVAGNAGLAERFEALIFFSASPRRFASPKTDRSPTSTPSAATSTDWGVGWVTPRMCANAMCDGRFCATTRATPRRSEPPIERSWGSRSASDVLALCPARLLALAFLGGGPGADRAALEIVPPGGAVLASEVDDLEMTIAPLIGGEEHLEVAFGLDHVARTRQTPAAGEAVDMGVDGKGGMTERLNHHDARGLVPHSRELLERLKILRNFSAVFFQEQHRQRADRLGFGGAEAAGANDGLDAARLEPRHRFGAIGFGKELGRHLVDADVGALSRQQHRDEEGEGIDVVEGNRRLGIAPVENFTDAFGLFRAGHSAPCTAPRPRLDDANPSARARAPFRYSRSA
jgi:glutamate-ammonia-ligase adenylyltransferase